MHGECEKIIGMRRHCIFIFIIAYYALVTFLLLVFECISCHISDGPIHSKSTIMYFHAFSAPNCFLALHCSYLYADYVA